MLTSLLLALSLYRIARVIAGLEQVKLNKGFIVAHGIGLLVSALSGLVLGFF